MPRRATYAAMEAGFHKGEIAMMINGPWSWASARAAGIDFGVTTIPSIGERPGRPFVNVLGCMITRRAGANADVARAFLEKHVLSLEGLETIDADIPLGTPANKAFYRKRSSSPWIEATMASAQLGELMPSIPEMWKFWAAMASALQNVTSGKQTPKDALDAAAARISGK
jgi:maltose/maltodextrin transport system substrate-binding protein